MGRWPLTKRRIRKTMRIIKPIVIIVAVCMVANLSIRAQDGARTSKASPETVVANLYKQHKKASPLFQTRSRALVDKYFDKQLADLLWKDATISREEVGALNGDPLYNAQDTEIKNFSIGKASVKNGTAQVKVSFMNFDRKEEIVFNLVSRKAGWKVSNLSYSDGTTLVGTLRQD